MARKTRPCVRLNEHLEHPDPEWGVAFDMACKMGPEEMVSKRWDRATAQGGLGSLTTTTRERRGLRYVTRARGWS
jgi:hypothetical protein